MSNNVRLLMMCVATAIGCAAPPPPASSDDDVALSKKKTLGSPDAPTDGVIGDTPDAKTDLYFSTFGDPKNQALIFLHGGPGATSFGFEGSAAPELAARGFYVIAYDQRGCGRSPKATVVDYNYKTSTADLDVLIKATGVKSPVFLPHSFGGSVALKFMEAHPGVAKGIILAGSPMNFPRAYFTILTNASTAYRYHLQFGTAGDMDTLREKMFPNGVVPPFTYSAEDIGAAVKSMGDAGLVLPFFPSLSAIALAAKLKLTDKDDMLLAINPELGMGYQNNDKIGYLDITPLLGQVRDHAFGIYGEDDGIFDDEQLGEIRNTLPPGHFTILEDASHFSYLDHLDAYVQDLAQLK